jgi:hypothetical protein
VKDAQYPDDRIVGWYHSHPGFGVFLSEHDIFIHRNFFSDPNQVAWVFDPHSDEEGCFVWQDGEIVRLQCLKVHGMGNHSVESPQTQPEEFHEDAGGDPGWQSGPEPGPRRSGSRILKWSVLTLSHILVLVLGFLVAEIFFPAVYYVRVPEGMSLPGQAASPETASGPLKSAPSAPAKPPSEKEKTK